MKKTPLSVVIKPRNGKSNSLSDNTWEVSAGAALLLTFVRRYAHSDIGKNPSHQSCDLEERVLRAVAKHGELSPSQLRALLGASPMSLSRCLRSLLDHGRILAFGTTRARIYRPRAEQPSEDPVRINPPSDEPADV